MASGAEQGVETKVHKETHDSSRRYRCVDSVSGVCWGGLCTDDDYDDFHLDNNQWHEEHKSVSIRGDGKCSVSISLK